MDADFIFNALPWKSNTASVGTRGAYSIATDTAVYE